MSPVGASSLRTGARLAGLVVLVLGAVVLAAWLLAQGRAHVLPAWVHDTGAGAAAEIGLLALGGLLARRARQVAAVLALALAALGAAGIGGTPLPVALGVAGLAGAQLVQPRAPRTVQAVGLLVLAEGLFAIPGYLVYLRASYESGPLAVLPLPCAIGLALCSFVLLAGLEDGVAHWIFVGTDAGAVMLRRVLPVCLGVMPLVWFVVIRGERAGLYSGDSAVGVRLGVLLVLMCVAFGYTGRALRRADVRRARTAFALESVGADLDRRVQELAAELVAERSLAAVLADRERIAADLHDLVIQRLFAVAIDLEGRANEGGVVDVEFAVDGLDNAIGDLRRSIFDLKSAPALALDAALREITDRAAGAFDTAPALTMSGSLAAVPATVSAHVLAAAREGVSNAARHSGARHLRVDVRVDADALTLTVRDDGVGMDPETVSTSGMRNVRGRAKQLGGECTWSSGGPRGTVMSWHVPLTGQPLDPRMTRAERLTVAMRQVAADLVADRGADRVAVTLSTVRDLVDGDIAALVVPEDGELRVAATCGFPEEVDPLGAILPGQEALSAKVIASRTPMRIDDADGMPALAALPDLNLGPAMIVPVVAAGIEDGVVVLARETGRVPFSQADENAALLFATHVASLLALAPDQRDVRTWPSAEYDYRAVLTRPATGLLAFPGLTRPVD